MAPVNASGPSDPGSGLNRCELAGACSEGEGGEGTKNEGTRTRVLTTTATEDMIGSPERE